MTIQAYSEQEEVADFISAWQGQDAAQLGAFRLQRSPQSPPFAARARRTRTPRPVHHPQPLLHEQDAGP